MSTSEIKLDIDAIDNDLKRYKERIDNIDSYCKSSEEFRLLICRIPVIPF